MYENLGLKVKGQKYRFVDSSNNLNEEDFIGVNNSEAVEANTNIADTLTENVHNNSLTAVDEAKVKRTIKKLDKEQTKSLKRTENDITQKESRKAEHDLTYKNLSTDISTYQERVNTINDATTLIVNQDKLKNTATVKAIKNSSLPENNLEKEINNLLVKNNYQSDDKIIEQENNKLYSCLNPEVVKERYQELKKMRSLLYQQEVKNMHRNKIKSKLFHKIKKKQKLKQEEELLKQLQEVDPNSVKDYFKKQMDRRIDERISLKHSVNKFNKTVKRYNMLYDPNIKESLMENYKKRDKLMEKAVNPNIEDEDDEESEGSYEEGEEGMSEDEDQNEDVEESEDNGDEEGEETNERSKEKIDYSNILLDFDEEKDKGKEKKKGGILDMNFMKAKVDINSNFLKSNESIQQMRNKLTTTDKDKNEPVPVKKPLHSNKNEENLVMPSMKKSKESKELLGTSEVVPKNVPKVLTQKMIKELTGDDEKEVTQKYNISLPDNVVQDLQTKEDDYTNHFLVANDQNKKEFIKETYDEILEQNKQDFLQGWGSWTGDSKAVKTKEYLKKKRLQEIQERKAIQQFSSIENPTVKVTNQVDKKFTNYLVNELPYNINSKEQFEKLNSTALGPERNSLSTYKQITQPKVVKFIGKVIGPMGNKQDSIKTQKLNDIIDKATKKIHRSKSKL